MTADGSGDWTDLTATEGVTTFGTALGAERLGFKPRTEFGVKRVFADGNDISTRTGAMPFTVPAVVPTAVFIWAMA
jgi:hypothetical protein